MQNLPDYPFSPHFADIGGLRMHYLDEGPRDGPVVVMVHGNPSWSYYYRHLVAALADTCRCIVPDHIGMGRSDKPTADQYPFTLERRIDDLTELMSQLIPQQHFSLVVHDWGGMIGTGWALSVRERLQRMVVLNTAAFSLPEGKSLPWQIRLSRIPGLDALLNQGLNAFVRGAVMQCVTRQPMTAGVAAAYCAPYDSWPHRLAVKRFVNDIPLGPDEPSWQTVKQIESELPALADTPMLIGWGLQDFVFDEVFLNAWRQRFPHAAVHAFEDAGHYVLEDAADDLNPLIRSFLTA